MKYVIVQYSSLGARFTLFMGGGWGTIETNNILGCNDSLRTFESVEEAEKVAASLPNIISGDGKRHVVPLEEVK